MNVCLFDDEPLALELLEHQLNKLSNVNVLFTSTNANIEKYKDLLLDVDVVFLDIEMPETNGLELAEQITAHNPNTNIVFVTAYAQFAIKAFELHAIDYLLKPVTLERLDHTLER